MISVVVPIHNEEECLPELFRRLETATASWGRDYEIIAVDDGSRDQSLAMLLKFHQENPRWKVLSFSRNFGHQSAVSAGLRYASGDAVIVMDADLQDPPEILLKLIEAWDSGDEVVYAIRKKRKEHFLKRFAYHAFYRLLEKLSSVKIPRDAGDFCLMDRKVVDILNQLPERTRFLRGLRSWIGFRQSGLEYERSARHGGDPKYDFAKLLQLAFDGIFSLSSVPLHLANWLGCLCCASSFAIVVGLCVWYVVDVPLFGFLPNDTAGWTSLMAAILLLSGVQMLLIGLLGEYVSRIFDEVKQRPIGIIAKSVGFDASPLDASRSSTQWMHASEHCPDRLKV